MDHRHALGAAGERAARRHLVRRGWKILATNRRVGAEIDLIAARAGVLIGCEVKSARGARGDHPPLSHHQHRRLRTALETIARRNPELARHGLRLDLVLVSPTWRGWRVRHLPDWLSEAPSGESNSRSSE